jgi:hypothetical protein
MATDNDAEGLNRVLRLLTRLHRLKDRAYRDAWRKRGEVVGVFANIARKYDRLEIAIGEVDDSTLETLGDTTGDLCIYTGKYLTWLAETHPEAFEPHRRISHASEYAAMLGPEALERVLAELPAWEQSAGQIPPAAVEEAWERVREAFGRLEQGLLAQAEISSETDHRLGWVEKVNLAWALTDGSAWLLLRLAQRNVAHIESIRLEVERMEKRASEWA